MSESQTRISDDLRFELADSARNAEASNRPRALLVLATMLFVVAGASLIYMLGRRDAAVRAFEAQKRREATVGALAVQFDRVAEMGKQDTGTSDPLPDLLSRIEQAALEAGLPVPSLPRTVSQNHSSGAKENSYTYVMNNASLSALLVFVQVAVEFVPGLEVASLEIKPRANDWSLEVKFVRWERP